MRIRLFAAVPIVAIVLAALSIALIGNASAGGRPLHADLSGANEVPPADPDGFGTIDLRLNQGQGEICITIDTNNIDPPLLLHIHRGPAGVNGPVVVDFTSIPNGGCVSADRDLIKELRQNPEGFYFNVHNTEFFGGAIRGQLEK